MTNITVDELQKNLKSVLLRVSKDREAVSVIVDKDQEVILMDAEDYNSIFETFYLASHPANAERLQEGIRQHRQGQRKVIDVKAYLD